MAWFPDFDPKKKPDGADAREGADAPAYRGGTPTRDGAPPQDRGFLPPTGGFPPGTPPAAIPPGVFPPGGAYRSPACNDGRDQRAFNRLCSEGVTETSSSGPDAYWTPIGTSAYANDISRSRIRLPVDASAPGPSGVQSRYLVRLAAHQLPPGRNAIIHGLRLYADIGLNVEVGLNSYPLFQPIISPFWSFSDADISFHLTVLRGAPSTVNNPPGSVAVPYYKVRQGWSQQLDSTSTGILTLNNVEGAGGISLFPGGVPGDPVGSLGKFSDLRFPWISSASGSLWQMVEGPCLIGLYASVLQSDFATRVVLPPPADVSSLGPEERFLLSYPQAVYYSVAGSMLIEEIPVQ